MPEVTYKNPDGKKLPEGDFLRHVQGGVYVDSDPVIANAVNQARLYLQQTDWTQLADIPIGVRTPMGTWRDTLRTIIQAGDNNAVIPAPPSPINRFP